ncbi:orexin receptor type 2 [Patella vulgata]|uniref:orexin receptor type 2 n=1 Tax=Patella vulgata TaxID=6465 RepID=UPI0021801D6A|nr:orexin receptor type 2 [Patella vulgata]XP_050404077.1 orexin receptor type 2 [Patella vulgata]
MDISSQAVLTDTNDLPATEDFIMNDTIYPESGSGSVYDFDVFPTMSTTDINRHLTRLNYEFTILMIPAMVFLLLLMVTGIVGNILVLHVYLSKYKLGTTRCYVLALAVCDLLSCCISMPGEIVDMTYNYTFTATYLCKILRSVNAFTTFSSGLILIVVAIDRYKKICTPLRIQFSVRTANIVVIMCCVGSILLSLPATVLYGKRTISTGIALVNGTDCSTADAFIGTPYPLIYNGVQFLFFILGSMVLITLYSLIGKRIWRHQHFRDSGLNTGKKPVRISSTTASDGSSPVTEVVSAKCKRLSRMISTDTTHQDTLLSKSRRSGNRKTTLMLFLITVVFMLSFLPHLILMTLKALDKNSLSGSGGSAELAHNILLRSYFINSATNPIIYSFCSNKFRSECQKLFKCKK